MSSDSKQTIKDHQELNAEGKDECLEEHHIAGVWFGSEALGINIDA